MESPGRARERFDGECKDGKPGTEMMAKCKNGKPGTEVANFGVGAGGGRAR